MPGSKHPEFCGRDAPSGKKVARETFARRNGDALRFALHFGAGRRLTRQRASLDERGKRAGAASFKSATTARSTLRQIVVGAVQPHPTSVGSGTGHLHDVNRLPRPSSSLQTLPRRAVPARAGEQHVLAGHPEPVYRRTPVAVVCHRG